MDLDRRLLWSATFARFQIPLPSVRLFATSDAGCFERFRLHNNCSIVRTRNIGCLVLVITFGKFAPEPESFLRFRMDFHFAFRPWYFNTYLLFAQERMCTSTAHPDWSIIVSSRNLSLSTLSRGRPGPLRNLPIDCSVTSI